MGDSASAFGIYSLHRYDRADYVEVGNEGILTSASLEFWKGHYYCRLIRFDSVQNDNKLMLEIGETIARNIPQNSQPPAILDMFQHEFKIERSEKYFKQQLGLNNIRYIAHENVLALSEQTQGAVAAYQADAKGKCLGFVIHYPDSLHARTAFASYLNYLQKDASITQENNYFQITQTNGKLTLVAHRRLFVYGLWDAAGSKSEYGILQEMSRNIAGE